ncbi:hypothetical protein E2562_006303 [Oryza meyeriana var. granulata]|uniref:Uncharacterized protein n=1 Tax=Oryza meyeriana var. granulata TaxID=110450 RepID=A0A6G1EF66_9ORYZ|nr:hypothetical protein E2562_006303 [Oryza meyeriana var. granulata]
MATTTMYPSITCGTTAERALLLLREGVTAAPGRGKHASPLLVEERRLGRRHCSSGRGDEGATMKLSKSDKTAHMKLELVAEDVEFKLDEWHWRLLTRCR